MSGTRRSTGSQPKPAVRQGRVVVNGQIDKHEIRRRQGKDKTGVARKLYTGPVSDHLMGINQGDVCMGIAKRADGRNRYGKVDQRPRVLSVLNGATYLSDGRVPDYQFMGIADTRIDYDSNGLNDAFGGPVLQLGGINSIINTSLEGIDQGQYVYADIPTEAEAHARARVAGVDRDRIAFVTRGLNYGTQVTFSIIKHMINQGNHVAGNPELQNVYDKVTGMIGANRAPTLAELEDLFMTFDAHQTKIKKNMIGMALTPAGPGQQFDIHLGNYLV